jgi:hypothetical protein
MKIRYRRLFFCLFCATMDTNFMNFYFNTSYSHFLFKTFILHHAFCVLQTWENYHRIRMYFCLIYFCSRFSVCTLQAINLDTLKKYFHAILLQRFCGGVLLNQLVTCRYFILIIRFKCYARLMELKPDQRIIT